MRKRIPVQRFLINIGKCLQKIHILHLKKRLVNLRGICYNIIME